MGLPTYSVGTASVANGNQSVSFAGGTALTSVDPTTGATLAVCGPGDVLVVAGSGGSFGVIQSVVDATHVTLETPWAGSTNAAAAYKIYRQSVPFTGSAAALAQTVLNQGADTQPDISRTIDNGVARVKLRIGSDGKAKLSVGATGTADASLLDGISIDPTTGAFSTPNGAKVSVAGFRNRLINGSFRVWQRGTSFAVANNTDVRVADRWSILNNATGASVTASQVTAPTNFLQAAVAKALQATVTGAAAGGAIDFRYRLAADSVADLDGVASTFSFDVAATTSAGTIAGQVILALNSAVDNASYATNVSTMAFTIPVGGGRVSVPLTAAVMTGIKFGGLLVVRFTQQTSAGNMTTTVGSAQFEMGSVANNFEYRPLSLDLEMCERYFEKSYRQADAPGTVTTLGASQTFLLSAASATYTAGAPVGFKQTKHTTPTITLYSPTTGASGKVNDNVNAVDVTGGTSAVTADGGFTWTAANSVSSGGYNFRVQWTADAELG